MNKKLVFLTAFLLSSITAFSQTEQWDILIKSNPDTIEEFVAMRNEIAVTPGGGAAMFIVAMLKYAEQSEAGMEWIGLLPAWLMTVQCFSSQIKIRTAE